MIEDHDDTRHQQQGFRHSEHIRLSDGDRFDILDHVVAEIAKGTRRHWRNARGGFGACGIDEAAQGFDRRAGFRCGGGKVRRVARLRDPVLDSEPTAGFDTYEGVAAEALAAGNRFEQETAGQFRTELEHGADRCFDVSDPPADDEPCGHGASAMVRL